VVGEKIGTKTKGKKIQDLWVKLWLYVGKLQRGRSKKEKSGDQSSPSILPKPRKKEPSPRKKKESEMGEMKTPVIVTVGRGKPREGSKMGVKTSIKPKEPIPENAGR